jgi:hypothetical protein
MIYEGVGPMTTRIVRVGNTLTVEIPEELVAQASLPVGEPVEWVANGSGGISLVKSSDSPPQIPGGARRWTSFWREFQKAPIWKKLTGVRHAELSFGKFLLP